MRAAAWFALLAIAGGCVSARMYEGSEIPWQLVEGIRPGQTTRSQVLDWLGAPQNFSNPSALVELLEGQEMESESRARYPLADVFVYQLTRGRLRGFVALLYNRFELRVDSDLVVIMFGPDDLVRHIGIRRVPQS